MRWIFALWWICIFGSANAQAPLSLDPSFQFDCYSGNLDDSGVNDIHLLPDGRILVSGQVYMSAGSFRTLFCVYDDGAVQPTQFSNGANAGGRDIVPWNDRLYVIGGYIRRYHLDGVLDTAFYPFTVNFGSWGPETVWDLHPFEDGSLLVAGAIYSQDTVNLGYRELFKLTPQGYVDSAFTPINTNATGVFLREDPQGYFLFGGAGMSVYDGTPVGSLVRVDMNGQLDNTFQTTFSYAFPTDVVYLPDGRFLLSGQFIFQGDTLNHYLLRLNHDGTLDTTFNQALAFRAEEALPDYQAIVMDIEPYGADRYILAGRFWTVNGEHRGALCMIDSSGNLVPDELAYWGCDSIPPSNSLWAPRASGIRQMSDGFYYVFGRFGGFDDGSGLNNDQRMLSRLYPANVSVPSLTISDQDFFVSPNPVSDMLSIHRRGSIKNMSAGSVTVMDASGRTVLRSVLLSADEHIDVRSLSPGPYLLRLVGDNQRPAGYARFVKE